MAAIVSVERASQTEDGLITFTIQLSEPATDDVSVDYRLYDGSADVGTDVRSNSTSGFIPLAGRLAFDLGEQFKTLTFYVDELVDVDEHFSLRLFNPVNSGFGAGIASIETTGWILDADGGANRGVAVSSPVVVEGDTNTALFTVSLSEAFAVQTTLNFATADGSALAGTDYVARTGSVTFAAGQTEAFVAVTLLDDAATEAGESFTLNVAGTGALDGASGEARILDDDGILPIVSVEGASQIEEGLITFTVQLSAPAADDVSVGYRLVDGSADVGSDVYSNSTSGFVPLEGTLAFALGEQLKTLTFYVADVEVDEHFSLRLFNPISAAFGAGNSSVEATGFILDTDGGLNRGVDVTGAVVSEQPGAAAVFNVTISTPSSTEITLDYETVPGTASVADFVAQTGTVTVAPGQTSAQVVIPLRTDGAEEVTETFSLQITVPAGAGFAAGTIVAPGIASIVDFVRVGTPGNDRLVGTPGGDQINGLAGNDTILGRDGDDNLFGGAGNDVLNGQQGDDTMNGGAGNDLYSVDSSADRVVEFAGPGSGNDLVLASASFTLADNVERLTLTGIRAITGSGNELDNTLVGNVAGNRLSGFLGDDLLFGLDGNDNLAGGLGNDTLVGGSGADIMTGGEGNDLYVVSGAADKTIEVAGAAGGIDQVNASFSYTLATHVERLVLFGTGAFSGTGNASDNTLIGNGAGNVLSGFVGDDLLLGLGGVDTLAGGVGNDTLDGGAGADIMSGGEGNDLYVVNDPADRIIEGGGAAGGRDQVNARTSVVLAANVERLALFGTGAFSGTGNASDNTLIGNGAGNALSGLDGADVLAGRGGNDRLDGGTGNDTLDGGLGSDTILFRSGRDVVLNFENNVDTLLFDDALLGGRPQTPAGVLSFAELDGGRAVFTFAGGNTLTVLGVRSLAQLEDDIGIF